MHNRIRDEIETKLGILIDLPLVDMGRAGSMLWLGFGEKAVIYNRKGLAVEKCKYYLNIQCSWRLTKDDLIVVASKDIYMPRSGKKDDNFIWDEFGANRFDERVDLLKQDFFSNIKVTEIRADSFGGCRICLNFGTEIEIFPDDSFEDEFWRFITVEDTGDHFIVFDKI